MSQPFRGIFPILQTPFNAQGDLVWDDFERLCDFIARSGAHGFVWPVMASEFTVVSFPERVEGMRRAVRTVAGRVPVVIGVADTSTHGAVSLAREAGEAGADAVIAMPPWHVKIRSRDLIVAYYRAIADAAGVPVFVQNAGAPLGSALPGSFVVDLCREIPLVQYLKEEKPPQGHSVSEVIDLCPPDPSGPVKGVFSGSALLWVIPEYRRGVSGVLPACYIPDVDARIWNLLEAGDEAEARRVYADKMVLENTLSNLPTPQAQKEVLVRRGVISCNAARNSGPITLDPVDEEEIAYALDLLRPYLAE